MRLSFVVPNNFVSPGTPWLDPAEVAELAPAVEAAGFDAISVTDHPFPSARWLAIGGHHALDPFVPLAFFAATTSSIALMTNVLVLPYRPAAQTAKAIASLDVLSGGRLIVGTAVGYLEAEFEALGLEHRTRAVTFERVISEMKAAWRSAGEDGAPNVMLPAPAQTPHPPIWIGGNSRAARRRAVAHGQGWMPFAQPPIASTVTGTPAMESVKALARDIADLQELAAEHGRGPLEVCFGPDGSYALHRADASVGEVVDELGALAAAGVTWVSVQPRVEHPSELGSELARIAKVIEEGR